MYLIYDCIKKDKWVLFINFGIYIKISVSYIKMCLFLFEIEKFNDNFINRIFLIGVLKYNCIWFKVNDRYLLYKLFNVLKKIFEIWFEDICICWCFNLLYLIVIKSFYEIEMMYFVKFIG